MNYQINVSGKMKDAQAAQPVLLVEQPAWIKKLGLFSHLRHNEQAWGVSEPTTGFGIPGCIGATREEAEKLALTKLALIPEERFKESMSRAKEIAASMKEISTAWRKL